MRISFLIPALKNAGPILVVRDIISKLVESHGDDTIYLFYFDKIENPISVDCTSYWIHDKEYLQKLFESDIVHSHGVRPDFYIFRYRKKIVGKCVSTIHSLLYKEYRIQYNWVLARLVEFIWSKIVARHNRVVVLSEVMKRHYTSSLPHSKMTVINNGRNISDREIDDMDKSVFTELKHKYKILGIACVLNKGKGLHQVINVLPLLPTFAFVVIGDGPERQILEAQAADLGVQDRCIFLGQREEGNRYNRYFDFYIFPSYNEGMPLSLLEAAAANKAIICSDIEIHREIFNDNEVSFFKLDDKLGLCQSIGNADNARREFETKALFVYINKYTSEIMADSYYKLYGELMNH